MLRTTQNEAFREVRNSPFTKHFYSHPTYKIIDLDAAKPMHDYLGIGVSMTDASCWLLSQIDAEARNEFLKNTFTKSGLNLSIVRLNCGSSDYATELYNYNDHKGDVEMKNFSVARDEKYMIPTIKMLKGYNPAIYYFSSIWSVPGWMKTSGEMCGGALLDEHIPSFANYWAAYLKAYKEQGIEIDAITIQNEPLTDQRGGCPATFVSAEQEGQLAGKYLPQAFKNVLPALANEFIVLLKETSVAGYIAIADLTKGGDVIRSQTYDPFLPLIAVAVIYLVMVMFLTSLVTKLERRLAKNDKR